jgi:fibronectin type III domain protein
VRRLSLALAVLSAVLFAVALVPSGSAGAAGDAQRGLVFDGLRKDAGVCRGAFRITEANRETWCSHGPDAAPDGMDVRRRRAPEPSAVAGTATPGTAQAGTGTVQCFGAGSDGFRVQLLYAHAANVTDRYAQYQASFTQWAAALDNVFDLSAAETGGSRHVRFVTDSSCAPVVTDVALSTTGDDNINNTISELKSKGYTRSDRKYLVWVDANVYCGIAQVYGDDSPAQNNLSNGNPSVPGEFARVDNGCWGLPGQSIEAHELMHALGGVQTSAPHATQFSHCWDDSDRMCYDDGSGTAMKQICPAGHENAFDCNHDDYYFAGAPPAGNYLASHWNVANSVFLSSQAGSAGTPPPPPPPGPTAPSAPRNLAATSPAAGGIKLTWQAPASNGGSAVKGYDLYRHTAGGSYVLVKSTGAAATSWKDTVVTSGTTYWYVIKARNGVGVGPASNEVSQIPR